MGSIAGATQAYAKALELATDDAGRCQAWLGLAACQRMSEDLVGAVDGRSDQELLCTDPW